MRLRAWTGAAALLIVTALPACDNVQWGGAEVAIVPPPPKAPPTAEAALEPGEERLPRGPVLYYVKPDGDGAATLVPVGEIAGDSLRPLSPRDTERYGARFIAEHLRQGTEFALFRRGMRVGTFVARSAAVPDSAVCPRLPRATGVLELTAGAHDAPEFLALAKPHAPEFRSQPAAPLEATRAMQVVAPILAERLLRARGAPLPGNWQRAMAQIQPFPLPGARDAAFAATLLVGDTLGPGLDDDGYSLFFIARPAAPTGYDTAFVAFHDYARGGKRAPRTVDFLDWDRDEETELLLQVYGTTDAWFEAVAPTETGWSRIFHHRCEAREPRGESVAATEAAPVPGRADAQPAAGAALKAAPRPAPAERRVEAEPAERTEPRDSTAIPDLLGRPAPRSQAPATRDSVPPPRDTTAAPARPSARPPDSSRTPAPPP